MTPKPVVFLDKKYKTQALFGEYVKNIIYKEIGICYDVKNTYPDKYNILIKILERHPNFNSKSENMCNVKIMNDTLNPQGYKIMIIKKDGDEIDISWRCAITGKPKPFKNKLMTAMRVSIKEQTDNFKTNCNNYYCELCDSVNELQVDHNDTEKSAFDELAYNFVKENHDIQIPSNFGDTNDNTHRTCFLEKDKIFKDKWTEYHSQYAKLRILCRKCNTSRPKTKTKLLL